MVLGLWNSHLSRMSWLISNFFYKIKIFVIFSTNSTTALVKNPVIPWELSLNANVSLIVPILDLGTSGSIGVNARKSTGAPRNLASAKADPVLLC